MGNTPQESCELFNLVVRAAPDKPMIDSRMLEGTPEWIASRFRSGSRIDIEKLSKLPTVLTSEFAEEDSSAIAVAGYVDKPSMNPSISCPVMRFPSQALLDKGILSSSRWENARTRWTVVEGNPFRLFADCSLSCEQKKVPNVDYHLAAVMMPFTGAAELDNVYKAIKEGARRAGFETRRVDEAYKPSDITEEISNLVDSSAIVIADITGRNPNVMFECGFARGREKEVVLLTADELGCLPFDIRQRKTFRYHKDSQVGLDELSSKVEESLKAAFEERR